MVRKDPQRKLGNKGNSEKPGSVIWVDGGSCLLLKVTWEKVVWEQEKPEMLTEH